MKHQKINLLNEANSSKFIGRKQNTANDQSNANYGVGNEIIYNTEDLKSNRFDDNIACILVRGDVTIIRHQLHLKIVHHSLNVSQKLVEQQ